MHHAMTIESEPTEFGSMRVYGECSCGGWFDLRAAPREPVYLKSWSTEGPPKQYQIKAPPEFRGSAYYNGYPPCPAAAYATRFERECES